MQLSTAHPFVDLPNWLTVALIRLQLVSADPEVETRQKTEATLRFREVPVTERKYQLVPQEDCHFTCFNYRLMERHGVRRERY